MTKSDSFLDTILEFPEDKIKKSFIFALYYKKYNSNWPTYAAAAMGCGNSSFILMLFQNPTSAWILM